MSRALVIGVGNPDRGDDGVGPAVARRLPRLEDVRVEVSAGGATELLELFAAAPMIVVVDAMRSGAPPGTVQRIEAAAARASPGSTHGLGVCEALELARCLGRRPPWLAVLGVEGGDFTLGAGLSAAVEAAVPAAVRCVLAWLARAGCAGARRPGEALAGQRRSKGSEAG